MSTPLRRSSVAVAVIGLGQFAEPCLPPDAFAASAGNGIDYFRGAGESMQLGAHDARAVLVALLGALDSSARGAPIELA